MHEHPYQHHTPNWLKRHKLLIFVVVGVLVIGAGMAAVLLLPNRAPTKTPTLVAQHVPANEDPQAVKQAVNAYAAAFYGGHGATVYDLLSQRCQSKSTEAQIIKAAQKAHKLYGPMQPTDIIIDVVSPGKATAEETYPRDNGISRTPQSWLYQGGSWRYNGC